MIKKISLVLLMVLFCIIIILGLSYNPPVRETSAPEAYMININGKPLKEAPVIKEETVYLPLREICEEMGYTLIWEESAKSIEMAKDKTVIKTKVGSDTATVTKKGYKLPKSISLKKPPLSENNKTFLSMQDMRDIFEIKVEKESATINIKYNTTQKNYITFSNGMGKTTLPLIYSDKFFSSSAFGYSPELAELSCVLSSGAYAMSSINNSYKKMGYTAEFYNYATESRLTSAHSIATKELADKKIYIVNIRGTSGDEWYTNFDIYKDKNTPSAVHYGFAQAEKNVADNLEKLLAKDGYKGRRVFLITGHSRGGAVANLLAAQLTGEGKYAQPSDIYAYTFAAPNVSTRADEKMKNIYNFCSASDFITQIPLNGLEYDPAEKEWLYKKNGSTIIFDSSDIKQVGLTGYMEREFRAITGKNFTEISRDAVQTAIISLKTLIPTVNDYYTKPLGIGSLQMSAYEFFISGLAASQTLGAAAEKGMMIIAGGLFEGDMSAISRFLVFNSTESAEKNSDGSITQKGQGIKHNHSCEAYYSWLKAYNRRCF